MIDARRERKQAIKADNSEREAKPEGGRAPSSHAATTGGRAAKDRHERPDRTEQNRRQREQDDDGTVEFGNDMPAFMKVAGKV